MQINKNYIKKNKAGARRDVKGQRQEEEEEYLDGDLTIALGPLKLLDALLHNLLG